jgi:hypothetical protein
MYPGYVQSQPLAVVQSLGSKILGYMPRALAGSYLNNSTGWFLQPLSSIVSNSSRKSINTLPIGSLHRSIEMATKETYPTFCQPNDLANISIYERDGMFGNPEGLNLR